MTVLPMFLLLTTILRLDARAKDALPVPCLQAVRRLHLSEKGTKCLIGPETEMAPIILDRREKYLA